MRNLVWGTVAACVVAAALGALHFTLKMRRSHAVAAQAGSAEEEQEAPRAAFVPMPHSTPSVEKLLEAMEIIEPIVVEGTPADPPPAPEFGGMALPGPEVRVTALGKEPPPRPDEEPGRRQQMPYAADATTGRGLVGWLWDALTGVFADHTTARPMQLNETAEPPAAEEQSEPPLATPPLPPVVDYHYHGQEMHCPYTGRCPVSVYPLPRPAAPPDGK